MECVKSVSFRYMTVCPISCLILVVTGGLFRFQYIDSECKVPSIAILFVVKFVSLS